MGGINCSKCTITETDTTTEIQNKKSNITETYKNHLTEIIHLQYLIRRYLRSPNRLNPKVQIQTHIPNPSLEKFPQNPLSSSQKLSSSPQNNNLSYTVTSIEIGNNAKYTGLMVIFIVVIGKMIKQMDKELILVVMVLNMKVHGLMIVKKVMVLKLGKMVLFIKVIIRMD